MRILLVSALAGLTASCVWPPPPHAVTPTAVPAPATVAAAPAPLLPPPPAPAVAVAAPPPAAARVPIPLIWGRLLAAPPLPGRLTLSNFSFDSARVQAIVTSFPDCAVRDGTATTDFVLPVNGTRIIATAPGADVCWRRELPPKSVAATETAIGTAAATATSTSTATPTATAISTPTQRRPQWTEWSRAYTGAGQLVDTRL